MFSITTKPRDRADHNVTPSNQLILDFPDCFDISTDARNVYKVLKSKGLHVKYGRLLDAYSIALCQQKNSCSKDTLDKRIVTLDNWGANQNNKNAISIVNSITELKDNKTAIFLIKVCDLCEKEIQAINNDNNILRPDKVQLVGFNSQFYRVHFDQINKTCSY